MSSTQVIGTIHLRSLAGSPGAEHQHPAEVLQNAGFEAVREAQSLVQAGFDAIILQNSGDSPFYFSHTPAETIACMAIISAAVREAVRVSLGIQIMENDTRSALAIASVTGCDFIRVRSSSGPSDELAQLLRERERLHSPVNIIADMGAMGPRDLPGEWMDGIICSTESEYLVDTQKAKVPLYLQIQNDANLDLFHEHKSKVDGLILESVSKKGSALKELVRELKKARRKSTSQKSRGKTRRK